MPDKTHIASFVAGALATNSLPHLATALSGKRHLTPIGGKASNRWTNAAWGAANVAASTLLVARTADSDSRWDDPLVAFETGAAVFAIWMAATERAFRVNHDTDK